MPQRFLLDTDTLSRLIRDPASLADRVSAAGEANICTSIVAACELRFGARKKNSERLTQRVEQLLDALEVMSLEDGVDRDYAEIRDYLESKGQPIGGNDTLIAAHAIHTGCVLVTQNQREFQRVPRLRTENWISPGR
jgi:tRNA(fMet)-specific endonuclease VapC